VLIVLLHLRANATMCDCFGNPLAHKKSDGSFTRQSPSLKNPQTRIPEKLAAVGFRENWQQSLYRGITAPFMPFNLRGEQFIRHPAMDKLSDLRYRTNFCYLLLGMLLWASFCGYMVYEIVDATCMHHGWTDCQVSQRRDSEAWKKDAAPLDVFMRTRDSFLTADIRACKIVDGSFSNYLTHASKNPPEIHPEEGGCEIPPSMLVSGDLIDRPPSDGGCLLFAGDVGYSWCNRLSGAKVIGQYGDPDYSFILVDIKANVKDLIAAGNESAISFAVPEIVGQDSQVEWTSMYYTFETHKPITKELFFQKVEVENGKGEKKQYTQYHHEFNRWYHTAPLEQLLAGETMTIATLYLRATTSRLEVKEWYPKTIRNVPEVARGFFTALFFMGSVLFFCLHHVLPKRLQSYEELQLPVGRATLTERESKLLALTDPEECQESNGNTDLKATPKVLLGVVSGSSEKETSLASTEVESTTSVEV